MSVFVPETTVLSQRMSNIQKREVVVGFNRTGTNQPRFERPRQYARFKNFTLHKARVSWLYLNFHLSLASVKSYTN